MCIDSDAFARAAGKRALLLRHTNMSRQETSTATELLAGQDQAPDASAGINVCPRNQAAMTAREAIVSALLTVFESTFARTFVADIKDNEVTRHDEGGWAYEAVHLWFADGNDNAALDGLVSATLANEVRTHYHRLGIDLTNREVALAVASDVAESLGDALPAEIVQAKAGSWIPVTLDGQASPVRAFKVPCHTSGSAAIDTLVKEGVGLSADGGGALWFHGTRFRSFSRLGEMDHVSVSDDPRQGVDFGIGFNMADTLRFAREFVRGEKKIVAVYRDPRSHDDGVKGTLYADASAEWQQLVFIGCRHGRRERTFKRMLRECKLKHVTQSAWIQGPMLKSHMTIARGCRTPADCTPIMKPESEEMEIQLAIRAEPEATRWDSQLIALLVYGAPENSAPTMNIGAGAGAGADADADADAGAGAGAGADADAGAGG